MTILFFYQENQFNEQVFFQLFVFKLFLSFEGRSFPNYIFVIHYQIWTNAFNMNFSLVFNQSRNNQSNQARSVVIFSSTHKYIWSGNLGKLSEKYCVLFFLFEIVVWIQAKNKASCPYFEQTISDFYSLFHQGLPNSIVISLGIKNREAGFCFFRDLNQFEVRALGAKKWFWFLVM